MDIRKYSKILFRIARIAAWAECRICDSLRIAPKSWWLWTCRRMVAADGWLPWTVAFCHFYLDMTCVGWNSALCHGRIRMRVENMVAITDKCDKRWMDGCWIDRSDREIPRTLLPLVCRMADGDPIAQYRRDRWSSIQLSRPFFHLYIYHRNERSKIRILFEAMHL